VSKAQRPAKPGRIAGRAGSIRAKVGSPSYSGLRYQRTATIMRNAVLALMVLGSLGMPGIAPASAADFPYCIRGDNYESVLGDCSFATYAQCQATASGRAAYCAENPYFSRNTEQTSRKSSHRRH
jgi:hypothetical protein